MKRLFVLMVTVLVASAVRAGNITVAEPEFFGSYCILTSDSTFETLPKETGVIEEHKNKAAKIGGILSKVGGAASVIGVGGILGAGSASGVMAAAKVAETGMTVSSAGGAVGVLAGSVGMDVAFDGESSAFSVKAGQDIRIVVSNESNDYDPMDMYRVVRFVKSKKDRRVRWFEFKAPLLGGKDAEKAGFLAFAGQKYGESSYLLTIPAEELKKGEYGIFYMNVLSASQIPVATFSVK